MSKTIHLSNTAKEKCFRLIPQNVLKEKIRDLDGHLYVQEDGLFNLVTMYNGEWVQILYNETREDIVVVTQFHKHEGFVGDLFLKKY